MRKQWKSEIAEFRRQILVREKLLQGLDELEGGKATLPLVQSQSESVTTNLGLTDAIREVFRFANRQLSATDVREELLSSGFQPRRGSNFLVMIHGTLARLVTAGELEEETVAGKSVYAASPASIHTDRRKHGVVVLPARSPSGEPPVGMRHYETSDRKLSRREKVELVLKLRSEGRTNTEIAKAVGMETHDFQNFLTPLFRRGLLKHRDPGRHARKELPAAGENL